MLAVVVVGRSVYKEFIKYYTTKIVIQLIHVVVMEIQYTLTITV